MSPTSSKEISMNIRKSAILCGFAILVVSAIVQQDLIGQTCSSGLTLDTTNGAKCGGWAGTGMPCETTGPCQSPPAAWMTALPGCASGVRVKWATAPVMSTCMNTHSSHSCSSCGGSGPTSGMECASGWLYSSTGYGCFDPADPNGIPANRVCEVKKYCGGPCCQL